MHALPWVTVWYRHSPRDTSVNLHEWAPLPTFIKDPGKESTNGLNHTFEKVPEKVATHGHNHRVDIAFGVPSLLASISPTVFGFPVTRHHFESEVIHHPSSRGGITPSSSRIPIRTTCLSPFRKRIQHVTKVSPSSV